MAGNPQVLELLEEMLNSGKTPEDVCRDCPELLPELRQRWQEFQLIDAQVRMLFPSLEASSGDGATTPVPTPGDLPRVPEYEVEAVLGYGGMGVVYRATDSSLGREVAVKVLLDRFAPDSGSVRRFAEEARITAQLQHPGIPPVHDLGTLPDGRPFLVMKLIKGQTLAALLASRPEPSVERGRFVAVFELLCQTVAYAHAHGVIHRDLKPANVMVGRFGEVQVMDWGLAKVLGARPEERPEAEEKAAATAVRSLRESDDLFTRAGSVLGTPAFMAPEQAAGAAPLIDRRSDVFGLGAVLAVVLTGRPPFEADTAEATRVKAARADVGECFARLGACGADPDLVALCRRCLAPRPEDRPADADAVAKAVAALRAAAEERARRAELDRVRAEGEAREALARAAEQRRRRLLLLTASGIIAVVLLAGLSVSLWQMRRAMQALAAEQQARQDETKARQQAFAALRSMTADVVERKFAQGAVLTEDDRAFLRGVIAQFDAFAAIKGDDADSRAVRGEGLFRVGTMRYRLGELKDAEQDYDQALIIFKQLAAEFPSRPEFRRQLAASHTNRGILLRDTGLLKEAEKEWHEALIIFKQLAAAFPSRLEFRRQLAASHTNRGILLRDTGLLKEAEKDYDQALSICGQLAAEFPSRPEFREQLATSHINRGILLRDTGRLKEAEKDYDQALSIYGQLAADFPSRPEFRQKRAASYNNRGNLLGDTGRLEEAEKDYDQALSIYGQLAADFPTRLEFRRSLAASYNNRGILLRDTGRLKEAEKDYDQALSIQKQLAADFPNQPDLRSELANTYGNLAILHQQQGNSAAAKRLLLEGRPHHLIALKANPRHPAYRQFYRDHLNVLTAAHAGLLEQEDAVRTAETYRDLGWDAPADAYNAACLLSLCVPIMATHDKLDAGQRREAARFYGDAAMKLLREAVSKGYKDVPDMKKDTDLDPLRQREDFRQLVAELEGKGK
jgi:serine/threonine protein kinase